MPKSTIRGRVVDSGVSNKTVILLGVAGYKMIITISAIRKSLVSGMINMGRV